ncbi:MAG: uroporphyrinogen decarboxylase family protein [Treponema sp.]|jgi:uroporphyrinogen decarboxylase|nr:uroporphyrinogen decarboxylase family protein [Treponema sp.]
MKLHNRKPDIENLYKVLRREKPARPTLFELFMNQGVYEALAGRGEEKAADQDLEHLKLRVEAFGNAGYDYTTTHASNFAFKAAAHQKKNTISLNEGFVITGEQSFESFTWPEPEAFDCSRLEKIRPFLPEGMKLMVMGPGGVLENVIDLVGYDNLCIMIYEEPDLAQAIFDRVGSLLCRYYEIAVSFDTVGLLMSNDDWGFKTQTFLSPLHMRRFVFPWHKKIVEIAHAHKMPAALHSCGYFNEVMDETIDFIGFDGKHSYEDVILPVEESYERWHERIAILGGMDVNFMINSSPDEITRRCRAMLERTEGRGAYALGTGNSIPEYIPQENYFTLLKAALEY